SSLSPLAKEAPVFGPLSPKLPEPEELPPPADDADAPEALPPPKPDIEPKFALGAVKPRCAGSLQPPLAEAAVTEARAALARVMSLSASANVVPAETMAVEAATESSDA